jgi:hypothetical protein
VLLLEEVSALVTDEAAAGTTVDVDDGGFVVGDAVVMLIRRRLLPDGAVNGAVCGRDRRRAIGVDDADEEEAEDE